MATIRKEVGIRTSPERVWEALRDVGALHRRLAAGFVVDAKLEGNARVVTFGNGMVLREEIVSVDDAARRVVWAIVGQQFHRPSLAEARPFTAGRKPILSMRPRMAGLRLVGGFLLLDVLLYVS
jgi:uncharacterized protein YndB with AHSA1/START domain